MEYRTGRMGRVIVARGFDGEDLYEPIEALCRTEKISAAAVVVVGGLKKGKVVVGPKSSEGQVDPIWAEFDDAREILGVGTVFPDDEGPKLHLHGAIGRERETLAGCPRGGATIYCVLEVIVFEIEGIDARRELDPQLGLKLLSFGAVT